jgi:DNA-directed RNA polymerase specialized sigma24 family protein
VSSLPALAPVRVRAALALPPSADERGLPRAHILERRLAEALASCEADARAALSLRHGIGCEPLRPEEAAAALGISVLGPRERERQGLEELRGRASGAALLRPLGDGGGGLR